MTRRCVNVTSLPTVLGVTVRRTVPPATRPILTISTNPGWSRG